MNIQKASRSLTEQTFGFLWKETAVKSQKQENLHVSCWESNLLSQKHVSLTQIGKNKGIDFGTITLHAYLSQQTRGLYEM